MPRGAPRLFLYGKSAYIFGAPQKYNTVKFPPKKIYMTFQIGIFRPALIIGIIALLLALLENFKIHSNSRFCMGKKWERAVSGHVLVNYVRRKISQTKIFNFFFFSF